MAVVVAVAGSCVNDGGVSRATTETTTTNTHRDFLCENYGQSEFGGGEISLPFRRVQYVCYEQ